MKFKRSCLKSNPLRLQTLPISADSSPTVRKIFIRGQTLQVWTCSCTLSIHSYFLQCVIRLFAEFWAVNMRPNERFLLFIEDWQSNGACLCNVQCADYKNRNKEGDGIDFIA